VEAALSRILNETRGAILVCFADNTLIVGEIMARALMLHDLVSKHRQSQLGSSDLEPTSPFRGGVRYGRTHRCPRHKDGR
jgi:hypothetical protein